MPVVFDSGVWISALRFGGVPFQALRKAYLTDRIVCCAQIRDEVHKIMSAKFAWAPEDISSAMNRLLDGRPDASLPLTLKGICRDPKDDMILECALIGAASRIVSGDLDLLVLGTYSGISIVTARQYLEM